MKTENSFVQYVIIQHEIYAQIYVQVKHELDDGDLLEIDEMVEMLIQHEIDHEHDDQVERISDAIVHDAHDAHDDFDIEVDEVVDDNDIDIVE